jgi:hypothetical protein
MRFRSRYAVALVLVLWALAGPVATSFSACAAMAAMCEGPCGVGPAICSVPIVLRVIPVLADVQNQPLRTPPSISLPLPETPPKPLFPSA